MNYFELFELPVRLQTDGAQLRRQYLALSRRFHPDRHAQSGAEEQAQALESSALVNRAFKVLGNREETIAYVLRLKGLLAEEEKYVLPPGFLMEMMDINEAVAELSPGDARIGELRTQLDGMEEELYNEVKGVVEGWQEGSDEAGLAAVKAYYFKKKYLDRLRQQLEGML